MPDKPVSVTRLSDIIVGEYYRVVGTDSTGCPIPPQIAHVLEPPQRTTGMGVPTVKVDVMAKIGARLVRYQTQMDLWSINVKEGGKGTLTGHGMHDREMIRMTHPKELQAFFGDDSYKDMMKDKRDAKVIVADRWGNYK